MKITVSQENFSEALTTVSKAVSAKNTIPVLSGVYLEARGEGLQLRATDLELAMECSAAAQVQAPGAVVLPARFLTDLIRRIPFGDIELAVDTSNYTATLRWGKSQYLIHGFPPDQFPQIPSPDAGASICVPQPLLRDVLRQTTFAAAHDETRPYLTGVYFTVKADTLSAVATDSVRIAHSRMQVQNAGSLQLGAIIPGRSLNELTRVLSGEASDTVEIAVSSNQVYFDLGRVKVISRLLEGQYPDVMRLVPQQYQTAATIAREAFLEAVERAALITKDGALKLRVDHQVLTITANAPEVGQVYEEIPLSLQGEPLEIGFNARYLVEGLKAVDEPEFVFDFSGSRNPARLRPNSSAGFVYVVLPLITY